jgi:hypothetical protein
MLEVHPGHVPRKVHLPVPLRRLEQVQATVTVTKVVLGPIQVPVTATMVVRLRVRLPRLQDAKRIRTSQVRAVARVHGSMARSEVCSGYLVP